MEKAETSAGKIERELLCVWKRECIYHDHVLAQDPSKNHFCIENPLVKGWFDPCIVSWAYGADSVHCLG